MDFPRRITVQSNTITIVPHYAETDQGGVVHHSVYPVWFEMGRTELLRVNGLAYKNFEAADVFFVVAELCIKYHQPAKYDEKLQLQTSCSRLSSARLSIPTGMLGRPMGQFWLRAQVSSPASTPRAKSDEYLNLCIHSRKKQLFDLIRSIH